MGMSEWKQLFLEKLLLSAIPWRSQPHTRLYCHTISRRIRLCMHWTGLSDGQVGTWIIHPINHVIVHAFVCRWEIENAQLQKEWHGEKEGADPGDVNLQSACMHALKIFFLHLCHAPAPSAHTLHPWLVKTRSKSCSLVLVCTLAFCTFSEADRYIASHHTYTYINFQGIHICMYTKIISWWWMPEL